MVVQDASLEDVVAEGLDWWGEATRGDARMTLADRCDEAHACVTVKIVDQLTNPLGGTPEDGDAVTHRWEDSRNRNGADIEVLRDTMALDSGLVRLIIAHELGHALGLDHVKAMDEVMRPDGDAPTGCIGVQTQAEYSAKYGGMALTTVCK